MQQGKYYGSSNTRVLLECFSSFWTDVKAILIIVEDIFFLHLLLVQPLRLIVESMVIKKFVHPWHKTIYLELLHRLFRLHSSQDLILAHLPLQKLLVGQDKGHSTLAGDVDRHWKLLHLSPRSSVREHQAAEGGVWSCGLMMWVGRQRGLTHWTSPAVLPEETAVWYSFLAFSFSFTAPTYTEPLISLQWWRTWSFHEENTQTSFWWKCWNRMTEECVANVTDWHAEVGDEGSLRQLHVKVDLLGAVCSV